MLLYGIEGIENNKKKIILFLFIYVFNCCVLLLIEVFLCIIS